MGDSTPPSNGGKRDPLLTILVSVCGAAILLLWNQVESKFVSHSQQIDNLTSRATTMEVWRGSAGENLDSIKATLVEMKADQRAMSRQVNELNELIRKGRR